MRHSVLRGNKWIFALALAAVSCGDDDTASPDGGMSESGSGGAGHAGAAGKTSTGGTGGSSGRSGAGSGGSAGRGGSGGNAGAKAGGSGGAAGKAGAAAVSGSGGSSGGAGGSAGASGSAGAAGASGAGGTSGTSGSGATASLNDAQIASVALTANMGEITQGNIAVTKAQNPAVTSFAMMLVQMHTAAQQRETALAATLNITPEDNALSSQLRSESATNVMELNSATSASFDALYVRAQIEAHQQVLDTIDTVLLPAVTDPMLKAELMTSRGEVQNHLTAALALAATLNIDVDAGI